MMALALIGLDKDLLDALLDEVIVIFDPQISGDVWGIPVVGSDNLWEAFRAKHHDVYPLLAVDPPRLRRKLAAQYGYADMASWTSQNATVSARAYLGKGVVIQRDVFVSADVHIEDGVRINIGAHIHHDCQLGSFATVAPGALLMGSVTTGSDVYVGAGAIIMQGLSIGDGAVIGAGAVVTQSVAAEATVVGIPAKPLSKRHE